MLLIVIPCLAMAALGVGSTMSLEKGSPAASTIVELAPPAEMPAEELREENAKQPNPVQATPDPPPQPTKTSTTMLLQRVKRLDKHSHQIQKQQRDIMERVKRLELE